MISQRVGCLGQQRSIDVRKCNLVTFHSFIAERYIIQQLMKLAKNVCSKEYSLEKSTHALGNDVDLFQYTTNGQPTGSD